MKKREVLKMFGGYKKTAHALDVTDSAVRQWPKKLGNRLAAAVIVASIQHKGVEATQKRWPVYFERQAS